MKFICFSGLAEYLKFSILVGINRPCILFIMFFICSLVDNKYKKNSWMLGAIYKWSESLLLHQLNRRNVQSNPSCCWRSFKVLDSSFYPFHSVQWTCLSLPFCNHKFIEYIKDITYVKLFWMTSLLMSFPHIIWRLKKSSILAYIIEFDCNSASILKHLLTRDGTINTFNSS